eukprot:COSAG01_NODE_4665_length_4837_cov_1.976361_2_plen_80_part_00
MRESKAQGLAATRRNKQGIGIGIHWRYYNSQSCILYELLLKSRGHTPTRIKRSIGNRVSNDPLEVFRHAGLLAEQAVTS